MSEDYKIRRVSNGFIVLTCKDNTEMIFSTAKQMGKWFADELEPETPAPAPTE